MDHYVTGAAIRALREKQGMTQAELAEKLCVSDKAVSKWETGRGFPDVSLLEPLGKALRISVPELLCGQAIVNGNRSANMLKSRFYVCPVCGNVIRTIGEAVVSCCGIMLPPLEPEAAEGEHEIKVEVVEDEYYVSLLHPMTRTHHISFLAAVSDQDMQLKKLYPEGGAEARFKLGGVKDLYACCNHHGLFRLQVQHRCPSRGGNI